MSRTSRLHRRRLTLEPLEDRTLLSLDFGLAFSLTGDKAEHGKAITADSVGNMYVVGHFNGAFMDADPGEGEYLLEGDDTYKTHFVAKYTATGSLAWARAMRTRSGGADDAGIGVDSSGNVYVTGTFRQPTAFGDTTLTAQGVTDVFLTKLDASGNFLWATQLGTNTDFDAVPAETGTGLVLDSAGNVYTTGKLGDDRELFIAKHDSHGNLVWIKKVVADSNDDLIAGWDIARDGDGNLYVAGDYKGKMDFNPGSGTFMLSSVRTDSPYVTEKFDAFVLKLDANGNFLWAGSMGGKGADGARAIAVDGSGNVHVTGFFRSTDNDFDPGRGKAPLTSAGGNDAFVVKLDTNRNFLWAKRMGGTDGDSGLGIAVDNSGAVYTAGVFQGTADFDPGSAAFNLTSAGTTDVFISQLSSTGSFLWAGRMGGASSDGANHLALDRSGNVYTTGSAGRASDFDPGPGEYLLTTPGVFVSKLVPSDGFLTASGKVASGSPSRPLTERQTDRLLAEALARWQAAGVDTSRLSHIEVRIIDLPGAVLGQASGTTIWLDDNAAGWGWFVDPTPWDDSEFTTPGDQGEKHRIDLLTVIAHEVGHLLGFDHAEDGVMQDTLAAGTRWAPSAGSGADWLLAIDGLFADLWSKKRK